MANLPDEMRDLCAQIGEGDGVDPRRSRGERRDNEHKTRQLCRQVMHAMSSVLAAECDDPLLRSIEVVDVEPVKGARCLRVVVRPVVPQADAVTLLSRLNGAKGLLRLGIGEAISRKRVPEIVFDVEAER